MYWLEMSLKNIINKIIKPPIIIKNRINEYIDRDEKFEIIKQDRIVIIIKFKINCIIDKLFWKIIIIIIDIIIIQSNVIKYDCVIIFFSKNSLIKILILEINDIK